MFKVAGGEHRGYTGVGGSDRVWPQFGHSEPI